MRGVIKRWRDNSTSDVYATDDGNDSACVSAKCGDPKSQGC